MTPARWLVNRGDSPPCTYARRCQPPRPTGTRTRRRRAPGTPRCARRRSPPPAAATTCARSVPPRGHTAAHAGCVSAAGAVCSSRGCLSLRLPNRLSPSVSLTVRLPLCLPHRLSHCVTVSAHGAQSGESAGVGDGPVRCLQNGRRLFRGGVDGPHSVYDEFDVQVACGGQPRLATGTAHVARHLRHLHSELRVDSERLRTVSDGRPAIARSRHPSIRVGPGRVPHDTPL